MDTKQRALAIVHNQKRKALAPLGMRVKLRFNGQGMVSIKCTWATMVLDCAGKGSS